MFKSLKSTSTSLIVLGVLAVIVGIIAIAWPNVTILALVILFAVYAFMDAGLQAARAFSSRSAGPVIGRPLLALEDLAGRQLDVANSCGLGRQRTELAEYNLKQAAALAGEAHHDSSQTVTTPQATEALSSSR